MLYSCLLVLGLLRRAFVQAFWVLINIFLTYNVFCVKFSVVGGEIHYEE